MRVLICGGLDFSDRQLVYNTLDALVPRPTALIGGGRTVAMWAEVAGVEHVPFTNLGADRPDRVIVFPGGLNVLRVVRAAKAAGFTVEEFA